MIYRCLLRTAKYSLKSAWLTILITTPPSQQKLCTSNITIQHHNHHHHPQRTATMPSFLSKLRSFKPSHTQQQQHPTAGTAAATRDQQLDPTIPKPPATPDWTARRTFSISPKLRTFFDFEPTTPSPTKPYHATTTPISHPAAAATPTGTKALGVLDSPDSPASNYSGVVARVLDVEVVRRVSKGKVKRVEVTRVAAAYESACAGTQTVPEDVGARVKRMMLEGHSAGLAKSGWEVVHSADAGLLFMGSPVVEKANGSLLGGKFVEDASSLPMTGNLLLKLQRAIAADADLLSTRRRTVREIATLTSYQENLRKRKDALKEQLQQFKSIPDAEMDLGEKAAVEKGLVRVWEASIDTMDERLRSEERLEVCREGFEGSARAAFAVLALGLGERGLVDVVVED